MSVFQLFLTPEEIAALICDFAVRRDLAGALQVGKAYVPFDPAAQSLTPRVLDESGKLFLFPKARAAERAADPEVSPRAENWIDIDPGTSVTVGSVRYLILTTIQASDERGSYRPASWLRAFLKRRVNLTFGVDGVNFVYGGSGHYKNIGYSAEALALYRQGVKWHQFRDGNVEFHPA